MASSHQPLKGRQILDCSMLLPGPTAGKLLSERGARVLKIENPNRPDPARSMAQGTHYEDMNSSKELVWIDLENPNDRDRFHELVRKSDGLIEGFRPKVKEKLGLDEKTLLEVNPKLCIVSLVGYPEDSPNRDRAGHDLNFLAVTGGLSLYQEMPAISLSDSFSAYEIALAMACALDAVSRGEAGRRTVVSIMETLKSVQSKQIREFQKTRQLPHYGTTLVTGRYPCYSVYQSRDGKKVAVGAIEPKFWRKFCEILSLPELIEKGLSEGAAAFQVKTAIQARLGSKPWEHWEPLFASADCCVEPVLNYEDLYGV